MQPAIDYPWVVWKDERLGEDSWRTDIYAYNFDTREEVPVCLELGEQSNPDIDAGRVVYSDERTDPYDENPNPDECNIYMYDLNTGEESLIASAAAGQGNPSISGDRVAWVDWRDGDGDIYVKDLTTMDESIVCDRSGDQREPVLWGDYVVYSDYADSTKSVYMTDLSTGVETLLAEGENQGWDADGYYDVRMSDPFVADGYIVYSEREQTYRYSDGKWRYYGKIHLYEIETGIDTVIAEPSDPGLETDDRWHPEMGDGWVVWVDRIQDQDEQVFGYNIESGDTTCLVPQGFDDVVHDDFSGGRATVSDGIVAWHDHRSEPDGSGDNSDMADLYAMVLEDTWAPEITITGVADGESYATTVAPDATVDDDSPVEATLNGEAFELGTVLSAEGDYELVVTATDDFGNVGEATANFTIDYEITDGVQRVAGDNRYATAIEASKKAFPDGASTVVIATGANWPDALGGSALAGAVDGPLLLTPADALPATVASEIERLGATKAYVLGGTGAVGIGVEMQLKDLLGAARVFRLAGLDRYGTAEAVADTVIDLAGDAYDGTAFIATGANFPDALAASPLANANVWPILLADAAGGVYMPAQTDSAVILGGTGAVSAAAEAALKADLGDAAVVRHGGLDRFQTASLIADAGVATGMRWDGVGIATGANFPDALSGGAMLGAFNTVMLLTPTDTLHDAAKTRLADNAEEIDTVFIIGGTGAVSAGVEAAVKAALGL